MSEPNESEASSIVITPTIEDDVFVDSVGDAQAQAGQAGSSHPSSGKKIDVILEIIVSEVKQWLDDHEVDEDRRQELRARFAQTQEFAKNVRTTVYSAFGDVVKRIGKAFSSSPKDVAAEQQRKIEKLMEALRDYDKEGDRSERLKKLDDIWMEYCALTDNNFELFKQTQNFRFKYYEAQLNFKG